MDMRDFLSSLTCFTDLHLHLDGAVSVPSARALAALDGIALPDDNELLSLLRVSDDCRDLNEFLEKFAFPCSLLGTREQLSLAVKNLTRELYDGGVMYAEIRFAPQKHTSRGLTQEDAVLSLLEGIEKSPIPVGLILCCMRDGSRDDNIETVRLAHRYLGKGVVAADLAGAEALYRTSGFGYVFDEAARLGVPLTVHAGEADGADSVRSALDGGSMRIGHGVRAVEDSTLVAVIARRGITLELCPTSNIFTSVFGSIADFPLRRFLDAGVSVTVNTDDPSIEGTDIRREFQLLCDTFTLTKDEVRRLLENSVKASFATPETKAGLFAKIAEQFTTIDRV